MDVDPVEERTGNLGPVALDLGGRTPALASRIAEIPTRIRIQAGVTLA